MLSENSKIVDVRLIDVQTFYKLFNILNPLHQLPNQSTSSTPSQKREEEECCICLEKRRDIVLPNCLV